MNKELTQQEDRIPGPEASAMNCDESCTFEHLNEFWLADVDKWFCQMCIAEYWLEELALLVDFHDAKDVWENYTIEGHCDADEEFIGFTVKHPDPWPVQEITLKQLEQIRAEIKKKAQGKDCPNCPNQGWFSQRDSNGEEEQSQCEFCCCTPDSVFNKTKERNDIDAIKGKVLAMKNGSTITIAPSSEKCIVGRNTWIKTKSGRLKGVDPLLFLLLHRDTIKTNHGEPEMDYEKDIKNKLGLKSVAEFARYLGCPVRTIYALIKERRGVKSPVTMKWKWAAFIDCVKYRAHSVDGWKCKACGDIAIATDDDGRKPILCGACGGSTNFTPVRVVDESNG